jgi:hypothetical protein
MSARKVPALRHHKARGLAVVTLGGKDFYCGKFGSPESRREYDRVVGEWLAAGRPQVVGSANTLTMAELLVRYMRFAEGYYLPPSRELEGIMLALRPLKEKYGHTLATDFGPLSLRAVRDGWVRAGLARRHINARVGKIRRLFKFAVSHELVPLTPSPNRDPGLVRESSCPWWGWKGFSDEEATQCRADRGLASAG